MAGTNQSARVPIGRVMGKRLGGGPALLGGAAVRAAPQGESRQENPREGTWGGAPGWGQKHLNLQSTGPKQENRYKVGGGGSQDWQQARRGSTRSPLVVGCA